MKILVNHHDRLSPELARATAGILAEQGASEEEVQDLRHHADCIERLLGTVTSCWSSKLSEIGISKT